MSWSCPFHSFQLPLHVPDIFSVCPLFSMYVPFFRCESFPYISRRPIGFLVLCFPFIVFALPWFSFLSLSCPFQFPLFPFHFPLLSCYVDFLLPPLISLHFLAFPLCSPVFPAKTRCSSVFARRTSKNTEFFQIFGKRRQETQTSKDGRGIEPGTPVLRHRTSSNCRAVRGGPPCTPRIRRRAGGVRGVVLYPLLGVRHAEQCWRIHIFRLTPRDVV